MAARIEFEEHIPLMAEYTLREAIAVGKQRIDQGRAREAVLLAQALLAQHPHYLSAYYLLAEAALHLGYNRDALEIFQRILSADPESSMAHVALATIYAHADALDEAIWHMMRAFEVQPGVREIRERLRALYEQRDGRSPGRLPLNHAALARTYIANGWYERAEREIAEELQSETERLDLRAALVETQWRAGRQLEAVDTARALLEELPLCLKAHLVLSEFLVQEGAFEEAAPHLHIAEQLDPEHAFAVQFLGAGAYLQPRSIAFSEERVQDEAIANRLPEWVTALPLCHDIPFVIPGTTGDPALAPAGSAISKTAKQDRKRSSTVRATGEGEWQQRLYEETRQALYSQTAFRDESADWRASLYAATRTIIDARMPSWLATLRNATARLLTAVPSFQSASSEKATGHLSWVARLQAETQEALSTMLRDGAHIPLAVEQSTAAAAYGEVAMGQEPEEADVDSLLVTEDEQPAEVLPEQWVERLRADSKSLFVAPDEEPAHVEQEEAPVVGEAAPPQTTIDTATVPPVEEELLARTTQVEEETEPAAVEQRDERVPDEARESVTAGEVVEEAEVAPTALREEAFQEPLLEAEEAGAPVEEEATALPDDQVAVKEDAVHILEDELDAAGPPASEMTEDAAVPDTLDDFEEPDALSDDLLLAYRYRESGDIEEALAIYQRLAEEGSVEPETLLQVLMVWLAMGGAPPLAYRLVGDLHRRVGRLQDALAYYREAIRRS